MNLSNGWVEWYYIATYLLAALAIAGFIWSIVSSKSTAKTVERVQAALGTMVEPLVKVDNHQWEPEPGKKITCEHLPIGLFVVVRNRSSVPVQLYRTSFRTFYGRIELDEMVENTEVGASGTVILAPGEGLPLKQRQPNLFPRYLAENRRPSLEGAQFIIQIEVEYTGMQSTERKLYRTRQVLHFDCATPEARGRSVLEEAVTLAPATPVIDMAPKAPLHE